ncbi:magnesium chelatase subunit H [Methanofollis formosanus]|uniref:Magnesium chelatase subunit H n=1 Tax=Methanofollis formosanus TaxID=299308 RepID=A0A8G1A2V9_9EURY|nr:magnesium chelatase subunit H [Methanofollis formosanus]QYZ80167.1 magnesium chelatase subunit H [Methanofollis formosanus]
MKITAISTVSSRRFYDAVRRLNETFGTAVELRIYYPHQINNEECDEEQLRDDLASADAVLLDIRGQGRADEIAYAVLAGGTQTVVNMMAPIGRMMEITRLGAFSGREFMKRFEERSGGEGRRRGGDLVSEADRKKLNENVRNIQNSVESAGRNSKIPALRDAAAYVRATKYWRHGGEENYYNLFLFLLKNYLGLPDLPDAADPVEYPDFGIFHPELGYFTAKPDYLAACGHTPDRPAVGIIFHGGMHLDQNIPQIEAFIRACPEFTFVPVYTSGAENLEAIRTYFFEEGRAAVDAVINLMWFRINGGPLGGDPDETLRLLKSLDVPVFAPASMFSQEIEAWEEDTAGLSPVMTIMAVIWPELDGCIEPIPCCALQTTEIDGCEVKEVAPIPDRIDRICGRLKNWLRLKRTPNAEKRVAVLVYDYPPGEGNIGGAAYLDVFVSVKRLMEHLREEGYTLEVPDEPLHELFEKNCVVNSGKWHGTAETLAHNAGLPAPEYQDYFSGFPAEVQADVVEAWGPPPGRVMTAGNALLVPGLEFGNVFVGIQPARPPLDESDLAKATHDKTKPPHHQYIAYYYWLREVWKADLVFHVGTHGLAEFMKGKEIGMSGRCFPDILIGEMPHLYIYHILNTSESTIAKRRLYGTMVSYNSPPYSTSDLYERYAELEELIDEYEEATAREQALRAERVEEKIRTLAEDLHMTATSIPEMHVELYEMKRSIIPQGLHTLGEVYGMDELISFVEFVLRYDRDGMRSLNRILADAGGLDYDAALRDRETYAAALDRVDRACRPIVERCIRDSVAAAGETSGLTGPLREELERTLAFGLALAENYADNGNEITSCLRGLSTRYIEPRLGGDVVRTPDVLPTGTNMNQFDPTKIPTRTAAERGAEIAANTLDAYRAEGGKYPESVGIVLWGFETTKTGGESIGQVLEYLGVRVVRTAGAWHPQLEVVPLQDLGRPRIDCLLTICGFFRDMFPNLIALLSRAFALVSDLDEPEEMNFVKKHSRENLEKLTASGTTDPTTARRIACARIYGPRAGEYGTRLLQLTEDSIWKEEQDLADVFIDSMNHLYIENMHGVRADDAYRSNLSRVEMVSQVRDSHDYEVTDLDHYFEFFGGLNRAVRSESGREPMMMISDTTKEVIQTEGIGDVIRRATRTRLLNPKWIDAMLEHDFHGAQVIEERVYNTLGLAATTNAVDNWVWSSIAERFVFDEEMRKRLEENNRYATAGLMERLFEAESRGYWDATEEEMAKMRSAYLDLEGDIEERI